MSRTFQLVGSTTLNLMNTATSGVIFSRGGAGPINLPLGLSEGTMVAETWTVNVKGTSHDSAATIAQNLFKLAREAKQFKSAIWHTSPVYLQQQTTNETSARYSAVWEMRDIKIPDLFDLPFEANNELEGVEFTVIREHPWRSAAPGTLGSAITLGTSGGTSGAAIATVSNFRDSTVDNFLELPAAALGGDSPPTMNFRVWWAGTGAISRVIMGAKSRGIDDSNEQFCFSLNTGGGDNPSAWAMTYGTDASSDADTDAPGDFRATVDFSTDTTSQIRVIATGTSVMGNWQGEYLPMIRVQQIGGSAGDCSVSLRTFVSGSDTSDPYVDMPEQKTRGADDGMEVLTFPLLRLPPSRVYNADSSTLEDIVFKIYASRSTGTSTLRIYDLMLLPVDEGSVGADDAALDTTNGNGALRANTLLDIDAGVIADRTVKQVVDGSGNIKPVAIWARMNEPIRFENLATKTRVYMLLLGYPTVWGVDPMVASPGMAVEVEVFSHNRFALLRGSS